MATHYYRSVDKSTAGKPPDKNHLNPTMVASQKVGKLPRKEWQDITAKICHKVELSLVPPLPEIHEKLA